MTEAESGERNRIREIYRERDKTLRPDDHVGNPYHPRNPVGQLLHVHQHTALVRALNKGSVDLGRARVLDVGCGYGAWLQRIQTLGGDPHRLHGVDLSARRVERAAASNPAIHWLIGDGAALPFADGAFDLVLQVVVLSSILEPALRQRIAQEMVRVTRRGGVLLWLDLSKGDPGRLVGFSRAEVGRLFPDAVIEYWKPVHPRYFRSIGRFSPRLATILAQLTTRPNEAWLGLLRKERA